MLSIYRCLRMLGIGKAFSDRLLPVDRFMGVAIAEFGEIVYILKIFST